MPETQPIWLLRGNDPAKAFGGGANDKLAARGELGAAFAALVAAARIRVESGFRVSHLAADGARLVVGAGSGCCGRQVIVDELIVATGFRPDLDFVRELRIGLDPAMECPVALAPLIDPNEHSCGTVRPHGARELAQPEPGFYFAGMKSYGRAPTFLMLTGYEQVRSIAAEIAGDRAAARAGRTGAAGDRRLQPLGSRQVPVSAAVDRHYRMLTPVASRMQKPKQQGKTGCGCAS